MNIAILERQFALRSKYDISAPEQNYYAERKFFSFLANLQLFGEDRQVLAKIQQRFSLFREKYDFLLSDGGLYRFRCERVWKGVFQKEPKRRSGCTRTKASIIRFFRTMFRSRHSPRIESSLTKETSTTFASTEMPTESW